MYIGKMKDKLETTRDIVCDEHFDTDHFHVGVLSDNLCDIVVSTFVVLSRVHFIRTLMIPHYFRMYASCRLLEECSTSSSNYHMRGIAR